MFFDFFQIVSYLEIALGAGLHRLDRPGPGPGPTARPEDRNYIHT
jgi:hypothetical protein